MDVIPAVQSDASATNHKPKPAVPKKPVKLTLENDVNRTTHVRDMIRKLQEKEQINGNVKPSFVRMGGKPGKIPSVPEKEEPGPQASNQTLEDLKAIDEDIEKLRKQIEERDKIISALREAAEAKDKKLDNLMMEYSKLQSSGKLDLDTSPEPNRATSSSPSSPPLCNGELCWTDSFVNKNYREPVYAQLLNDHAALQKVYNDLRSKLESRETQPETPKTDKLDGGENAINLIMAEQIRALKEREAQLIWEAEELREQNDLMEFRILELEECRKEFLDKEMMNEGKHRTEKIVWRERDLEEVSDSGVMSLPTSEDLTSDSELGEAIRNYSPLGAVTALSLSIPENSHSEPSGLTDLKSKKSLKTTECLQESGIFVDADSSSDCAVSGGTQSKACQTESVLDKTLLDIIDSSCDLFLSKNPGFLEDPKSDDLSTEISKLSVIQKRIQQKTKSPTPRSPHTIVSCPHSNSVVFYEERLAQLEDKLKIYESSGDTKDILLAKRLQKEVELSHRVKELTDKVTSLEANNKKLEEEKCEFEEAENDTRFQCQRLEVRLQELIDKNAELELQLERQKVIMTEEKRREKKKGSLEGLINKYEQRNFELEEKEVEARHRLSMIEAAMPAIVAYNMFKMVQNPEYVNFARNDTLLKEKKHQKDEPILLQKLEDALSDKKKTKKESEESSEDRERALRNKIQELEAKAAKDREMLEEMTNTLKAYKSSDTTDSDSLRPDDVDLFEELKQMVANEIHLRAQIERLEKKEQMYMQGLNKADEIWAGMEADYKQRLLEAQETNNELQKRVAQLEAVQAELEKTLAEQSLLEGTTFKPRDDLRIKMQELLIENEKLKAEITRSLDEKFEEHRKYLEIENLGLKEEIKKLESDSARNERKYLLLLKELELTKEELDKERGLGERLRRDLEERSLSVTSVESNLQNQISKLTLELNQKSKELSNLEVTVAELREEVETLENKVAELVETIQTTIKNQEEVSAMMKTSGKISHRSLSADEPAQNLVSVDLPKPPEETVERRAELTFSNEILVKTEKELPSLQVLTPNEFRFNFVVFAVPFHPRTEVEFLFSSSRRASLLKCPHLKCQILEKPDPREEEIFQLSLRNTELQQILERMEEESKQKDKEFEKLQKIALEIRREQENLESMYGVAEKKEKKAEPEIKVEEPTVCVYECETKPPPSEPPPPPPFEEAPEETRRSPSIDVLQVINPVVVTSSEQVSTSISSLQIALDNLQSKYRAKNLIIKPLLNELKQKGDNRDIEDFAKQLAIEDQPKPKPKPKDLEGHPNELALSEENPPMELIIHKAKSSSPRSLWKSSSSAYPLLVSSSPRHQNRSTEVDPEFSFVAPIKTMRKVGDDGIFLEWDVAHQPRSVTGFEIKVNGLLSHRVRSSTRNKALLRPLNLKDKISIHLFAVSENGRSLKSSHVTYPDEFFLQC